MSVAIFTRSAKYVCSLHHTINGDQHRNVIIEYVTLNESVAMELSLNRENLRTSMYFNSS